MRSGRRWSPRGRPDRRGQALIEFCLSIPLLLLVFVGVVELTRMISVYIVLTETAGSTSRLWSRNDRANLTAAQIDGIIRDSLGENRIDLSAISTSATTVADPVYSSMVRCVVTITYVTQPVAPIELFGNKVFDPNFSVTAVAVFPREQNL